MSETIFQIIDKKNCRDNAPKKRVELHLYTKMSAMDGVADVTEAICRAADWGHPAIGITDAGVVQAFPEAMSAAGKAGIKVLYGCDMVTAKASDNTPYHITVFARNAAGLKTLYGLISDSHIKYFDKRPCIPTEECLRHRENLLLGSGCENGELYQAVLEQRSWEDLLQIASDFDFLEIEPVCNHQHLIQQGIVVNTQRLQDCNRTIVQLGETLGIPVAATGNVHFLNPEDQVYRSILRSAGDSADDASPLYFKTTAEMLDEFSYLGTEKCCEVVVTNTNRIAGMCEIIEPLSGDLCLPTVDGSDRELADLATETLHRLYGAHPPRIVMERFDHELRIIWEQQTSAIYIAAQRLAAASRAQGYPVGTRGLVGASLTAFLAGITDCNPLPPHYRCPACGHSDFEHRIEVSCGADLPDARCPSCGAAYEKDGFSIPMEPFFGFYGDKLPDIDLNFSKAFQEKAMELCKAMFGADHVFRAGTISTIFGRTARSYVMNYLREQGLNVPKAEIRRLMQGCTGVKRTTGQHPGGLVIVPKDKDILDFCPLQHPANDPNSDVIITHFEYRDLEMHLLKLDLLSHDNLTMLKRMADMTGICPDTIPLDDPETMRIFTSPASLGLPDDDPIIGKTGTLGIPEFGTDYVRQMLLDIQPADFDDLVRVSGLSHGVDTWLYNAKELIRSGTAAGKEVISTRDDILRYLTQKGMDRKTAFAIMEAVRKGKVAKEGLRDDWEAQMRALDVPQWYLDSLKKIHYLFPRAHAVTYTTTAFRIAWYKVHAPLAFYSAYFYCQSQKGALNLELIQQGAEQVKQEIQRIKQGPDVPWQDEDLRSTLEVCYEFNLRGFLFSSLS